jgi:HD superfamily phosphodiesterase
MEFNEEDLIKIAKPYLEKCRAGDWNHALRVVKWVKILGKGREDLNLLITAAYLHDVGWTNVISKGKIDFDKMVKLEPTANRNTPIFIREVMIKLNFDEKDIIRVINLVKAADKRRSEKDDEAILVDSDNLSKVCLEHLSEKYTRESYSKVFATWEIEFPKRIKTEEGKKRYPQLLRDLKTKLNL